MEMAFLFDAIGLDTPVSKDNSGIAHSAIPTPAALIPGCLFVNPLFDGNAVLNFGALTERSAD